MFYLRLGTKAIDEQGTEIVYDFLLQTLIPHPSISFAFYLHGWNVVYSCTLIRTLCTLFLVSGGQWCYTLLREAYYKTHIKTFKRYRAYSATPLIFLHENNMPINILVDGVVHQAVLKSRDKPTCRRKIA